MSTRIYSGKKIAHEGGLNLLLKALKSYGSSVLRPFVDQLALDFLSTVYFIKADRARFLQLESGGNTDIDEGAIFKEIRDDISRRRAGILHEKKRDRQLDFEVSLTLFPTDVPGECLAIPFAENPQMMEKLASFPGMTDYAYWNNTDQPEGISDEEWAARGQAWGQALGEEGIPALAGFTITLVPASDFPQLSLDAIKENPPPREFRLRHLLDDELQNLADAECERQNITTYTKIMETRAALKESPEWIQREATIVDMVAPLFEKKASAKP